MLKPHQVRALELSRETPATPAAILKLETEVGEETARWAFTQWELRKKARQKFTRADEMLFDRAGLEMASHEDLAPRAHRVAPEGELVGDLTSGIGGDLLGLCRTGPALGFELSPERAEYAAHNLGVYGRSAEIRVADCLAEPWPFEFAFADPARRSTTRRHYDPADFSPNLEALGERMAGLRRALVKTSPLLSDEFLDSLSPDRYFVSHAGECKEAVVQLGHDAQFVWPGKGTWALHVETGEAVPGERPLRETLGKPLRFVLEADPATIRAHCLGGFGLPGLGASNGYLTTDSFEPAWHWAAAFEAVREGGFHIKLVRAWLKELGGRLKAVKTRGVRIDPAEVRAKARPEGDAPLELLLYPVGSQVRAVLCRRVG
ncbi:MAG: hypothetical protein KIT11_08100 [Fimbriimonadaceae bacterium]|nr:hypothetical protein [Fimbriimonadaceae bacterium]QYK56316.1 MAG: hypothetical protein KF733_02295 [Fimbriimonadaceae bacterium]